MSNKPYFRSRLSLQLLAFVILLTTFSRLTNLDQLFTPDAPLLPPPLNQHLTHLSRQHPPPPKDWKRPHILTAHGTRFKDGSLQIVVFTAGVLLRHFDREFNIAACVIGQGVFPVTAVQDQQVVCNVRAGVHLEGKISLLIRNDEELQDAMRDEIEINDVKFKIYPGDLIDAHLKLPKLIRQKLDGDGAKLVASEVEWREGLVDDMMQDGMARYELCMVTSMKQYPHLLKGWIEFYKRLGVDQFYIYDNHAESDLRFLRNEFVQTVYWPYTRSQLQIFTHFLLAGRRRCKYVGFLDADEYVYLGGKGKELLRDYVRYRASAGFTQVIMTFYRMQNNGYVRRPEGDVPELYTKTMGHQRMEKGKAVIDMDAGWSHHRGHLAHGGNDIRYFNQSIELNPKQISDNAMLIHYSKRSWEEYVMKHRVGSASVLTAGRKVNNVFKEDEPMDWYMEGVPGEKWYGMRNFWRRVMRKERSESLLVWRIGGQLCRTRVCGRCWSARKVVCDSL